MDIARIRELFRYDPERGVLVWMVRTARRIQVGDVAGYVGPKGRRQVRFDGVLYPTARVIWAYVHGVIPAGDVDHKDGNPANETMRNLRDVSHQANSQNVKKAFAHTSTGLLGAHRSGKRFSAKIQVNGQTVWLGRFDSAEAAHAKYVSVKRQLHEGCMI